MWERTQSVTNRGLLSVPDLITIGQRGPSVNCNGPTTLRVVTLAPCMYRTNRGIGPGGGGAGAPIRSEPKGQGQIAIGAGDLRLNCGRAD